MASTRMIFDDARARQRARVQLSARRRGDRALGAVVRRERLRVGETVGADLVERPRRVGAERPGPRRDRDGAGAKFEGPGLTYRQVVRSPFRLAHEHRHTTGQFSSVATAVALCASLFLVLAACSAQGPRRLRRRPRPPRPRPRRRPVAIAGTSILRARVAPLSPGEVALPPVFEGSAAWLRMVPIAYRSFGSGPDLLLVSGQDGTLSWWGQSLLSDLSGHYRVTVFDLPGVGYSGRATAPLSLSWLADMTAGFALTVGLV